MNCRFLHELNDQQKNENVNNNRKKNHETLQHCQWTSTFRHFIKKNTSLKEVFKRFLLETFSTYLKKEKKLFRGQEDLIHFRVNLLRSFDVMLSLKQKWGPLIVDPLCYESFLVCLHKYIWKMICIQKTTWARVKIH